MKDERIDEDGVVHIVVPRIAFAVRDIITGGFGQIVVELNPGECETITLPNGRQVTIIRDFLH